MCPIAVNVEMTNDQDRVVGGSRQENNKLDNVLRKSPWYSSGCDLHPRRVRDVANEQTQMVVIDADIEAHMRAQSLRNQNRQRQGHQQRPLRNLSEILLYPAAAKRLQHL
ncbi:hypothetical protein COEREDRAFT_89431 [Coemansia reversa NRRL 1564]|uniref:Uncharacterized protein n=1 Tax=Coemansia reversa (strain ATCC 12441 / NRRL 1564) TaxID=763665 RepID=A0A2G5B3K0_COERN|nr:hypothetical protein COEREDRAFT_89431 [Coemansia reversa NRRL 1564]|eukprot:PIA13603.1 hypothetical protein COEREDRAFT_89431 [Coemansia reversa NRRL 1564]